MKVLLDTNVILDYILSREPYVKNIVRLFDIICKDEIKGVFTANSVTDIYYIIAKRLGDAAARKALWNLLNILVIIGVDGDDCVLVLDMSIADFEDAVIVVCAPKNNIDYIVSNDKELLDVDSNIAQVISSDNILRLITQ